MDQYILMCREATEIQAQWEPKYGDRFIFLSKERFVQSFMVGGGKKRIEDVCCGNVIYLPRIEDLIEMSTPETIKPYLKHDIAPGHNVIRAMHEWSTSQFHDFWAIFENATVSELWLCFVMHTLYNKSWNGKTWN